MEREKGEREMKKDILSMSRNTVYMWEDLCETS